MKAHKDFSNVSKDDTEKTADYVIANILSPKGLRFERQERSITKQSHKTLETREAEDGHFNKYSESNSEYLSKPVHAKNLDILLLTNRSRGKTEKNQTGKEHPKQQSLSIGSGPCPLNNCHQSVTAKTTIQERQKSAITRKSNKMLKTKIAEDGHLNKYTESNSRYLSKPIPAIKLDMTVLTYRSQGKTEEKQTRKEHPKKLALNLIISGDPCPLKNCHDNVTAPKNNPADTSFN